MTIAQAVIVYFVCWWLLFFMALPVGVRVPETQEAGHAPSAPANPRIGIKALIVTLLTALVTWGIDFVIASGIVQVK